MDGPYSMEIMVLLIAVLAILAPLILAEGRSRGANGITLILALAALVTGFVRASSSGGLEVAYVLWLGSMVVGAAGHISKAIRESK